LAPRGRVHARGERAPARVDPGAHRAAPRHELRQAIGEVHGRDSTSGRGPERERGGARSAAQDLERRGAPRPPAGRRSEFLAPLIEFSTGGTRVRFTFTHMKGSRAGTTTELDGDVLTVGRDPQNSLAFDPV